MTPLTPAQRHSQLITTDRKYVRIEELVGQPFILAFFPAAFTSVCTAELCAFRDSMARLNSLNTQVFGVSVDLPMTLKAFGEQNGLTFPLLSDCNREAICAFNVVWPLLAGVVRDTANRAIFVVASDGTIAYSWIAEAPRNEPPLDEVFAAVDRLQPDV